MAIADPPPSLEILVREPEQFSLWTGPPFSDGQPRLKFERVPCTSSKFSEDGSKLMVMKSDSVISIYDCRSSKEIRSFEVPNVLAATLSPNGTYLQTFQMSSSPEEKNVILWKTETGDSVYGLFQMNMIKTTWSSMRFSSDEALACCLARNEIQFFDPEDFSKGIIYRLRIQGVAAVELSKTPGSHVAAFVSESREVPASVQIFACGKDSQKQPLAQRIFFCGSTVQMSWNYGSTGLLAVVQSDVDKTNHSYYGESKLNYFTTDGTHEGLVPLRKEGPLHDVQWSYSGSEFAVVYGFTPAKATVFDKKCNPLLELGTGPYNTIRWNPKGRFLCLVGFGNLPGDMAFWDYMEKKQLRTTKAECSVTSEWSPDGCYFMTATTAPRLQVYNAIKIFHHNGSLYFKKKFDKLYQAEWKPESPDKFGEIAELPKSVDSLKVEEPRPRVGLGGRLRFCNFILMILGRWLCFFNVILTIFCIFQMTAFWRKSHASNEQERFELELRAT
ncbi:eukaryotic translation initiation factor 2A-like isoform X1 [Cornus florida]|uniref:eukaryotic translation initiation factor 2A-like isoform X1 n=1 Tax=Cornus florida TaxID=4283 RepID=UPI00289CE62C|nr:eukaryotic translation initiation factor 2A-like isoform X1 [Cornus florida]